jgi:post-segregation antitoxin (ccd killing protein)
MKSLIEPMDHHARAVRQYSLDTLEAIQRDLARNLKAHKASTWEFDRLEAIRAEIKRRRKP